MIELSTSDFFIMAIYFVFVFALAWWVSWKDKSPTFGLEQEQIDNVIAGQERESDMLDYIYNLILNDKYDA